MQSDGLFIHLHIFGYIQSIITTIIIKYFFFMKNRFDDETYLKRHNSR